jgi:hypothetical protein
LGPVVSAECAGKFLGPDIQRGEVKSMIVTHAVRSPNNTVPTRIIVAPSSTAIG